ncbi:hypothetical protein [Ferroplasma acidiphilum]|uniref:Uncharacterized protein n=1 Tax=Ferroplasma acidiphilum TaxID=74969 RepID=A0A1V0N5Q4_9ARCH|nr:hypothetical protein [Ferroplasma acidiphilum]ARD85416.1 hypothetical protein FAD_1569 [Ferroplasma acidiphilum]MCL4348878.1 hypothetical protein [Candidatus Thermoplasmatota archaeon]NOL59421.1 hypothetical protein [Ferroplasma acidiphilum]WMT52525.1 MAG: hypothetical protein RE473_05815 [Ferroplasma acidiphilum]
MTANNDTSQVSREKEGRKVESGYAFKGGDISMDRFSEIEAIGEKIGNIWQDNDLSILDLKTLMPYLASMVFLEAGDSDFDILDYIDNYMKPAIFEFNRRLRNSRKFKSFDNNTAVTA